MQMPLKAYIPHASTQCERVFSTGTFGLGFNRTAGVYWVVVAVVVVRCATEVEVEMEVEVAVGKEFFVEGF